MKFWGWIFRIVLVALGIGLFLLQSQLAKKSILEFILNQPFKNSTIKIEAQGIRGLFPFQFEVTTLDLKDKEEHLATLSNISVFWSVVALMAQEIKVEITRGKDLAGDIIYQIGNHALFANMHGDGLPLWKRGSLTSIVVNLPALDLLKGQIITTFKDDQEPITLSIQLDELDEDRIKISEIILTSNGLKGKGQGLLYQRKEIWEGEIDVSIASLVPYDRWVGKNLAGSAVIKCQKKLNGEIALSLDSEQFHYADLSIKSLSAEVSMEGRSRGKLILQGHDAWVNKIPLTTFLATGNLANGKGAFDFVGKGPQNISFHTQGVIETLTNETPQKKITLMKVALKHPMHQFSLKQPATLIWNDRGIRIQKAWLETIGGIITIHDLIIEDQLLSGSIMITQLPLTILRIINPEWIASGYLSGKGKLSGTIEKPEIELSLNGKSLQWGVPTKAHHVTSHPFLGIDLSSTFSLSQGILDWQTKMTSGKMLTLTSQGKLSMHQGYPTEESSLEGTIKGQGNLEILSLLIANGDLIQGKASLDFMAKGMLKAPIINGHISVTNGLYENASFGTLIRNIQIQGNAINNVITVSNITGQDNGKGRIKGHASLKFASLFNPEVDIQLELNNLLILQNDELSGKASGTLKLQGSIFGDEYTKAKIIGDVIIQPLEVRLEDYSQEMITIKLLEKKKDGSYQTLKEQCSQTQPQKEPSFLPLDIKMTSPGQVYLRGYGFDAQWRGEMRAIGPITDPQLIGEINLVRGKFDLLGKPLKLSEGRIIYSQEPKNNPTLDIIGTRDIGEMTATMRIEGQASDPKITFSSNPALPQEEILARLLFGKGIDSMSVTQSLLLANALSTFKGKNSLNFTDKIRSAFGLDVFEFKERKPPDGDDFKSTNQLVSVGKQITDKVYLSIDQSVSGDGGTTATIQLDVTPSLKIEADVGGDKNTGGVGFAWVKKY